MKEMKVKEEENKLQFRIESSPLKQLFDSNNEFCHWHKCKRKVFSCDLLLARVVIS